MTARTRVFKALFTGFVAVGLDLLFHIFYSSPMETVTYFGIKFLVVSVLAWWLFGQKATLLRTLMFGVLFAGVFGLYYRFVELAQKSGFLGRVPDVHIFGITATMNTPITSAILWLGVHGGSFIIGSLLSKKIIGGEKL